MSDMEELIEFAIANDDMAKAIAQRGDTLPEPSRLAFSDHQECIDDGGEYRIRSQIGRRDLF